MIQYLGSKDFTLQSISFSNKEIKKNAPCSVLLIKANWCGHCVRYFPEFKALSEKYKKINFLVVEKEDNEQLLEHWSNLVNPLFIIQGYPTVVLYDSNGHPMKVVERQNLEQILQTIM